MYGIEKHVVRDDEELFNELDNLCFLAKNLKNATTYAVRQHYFQTNSYLQYETIAKQFSKDKNPDYLALPSKVSQQTMMEVDRDFKSFFALLKRKNSGELQTKVSIPKYLDKDSGRATVCYNKQAISSKLLKDGYIKLSKTNVKFKTNVKPEDLVEVKITSKKSYVVVCVTYKCAEEVKKADNGRWLSIDLGVSRFATITSNVIEPVFITGNGIKSINQFYNKKISKTQEELALKNDGRKWSKKTRSIHRKRAFRVEDFLHKASRTVVNHALKNNISNVVIGLNKGWKQEVNMGRKNNQTFYSIPHSLFVEMVKYKCHREGIKVTVIEESYTSKCSFLDGEKLGKSESYLGKRTKRGMFVSAKGIKIHADVNGSLNILRKVIGNFEFTGLIYKNPKELDVNYKLKGIK